MKYLAKWNLLFEVKRMFVPYKIMTMTRLWQWVQNSNAYLLYSSCGAISDWTKVVVQAISQFKRAPSFAKHPMAVLVSDRLLRRNTWNGNGHKIFPYNHPSAVNQWYFFLTQSTVFNCFITHNNMMLPSSSWVQSFICSQIELLMGQRSGRLERQRVHMPRNTCPSARQALLFK